MAGYSGSRLEYLTRGGIKTRISRQRNPKLETKPSSSFRYCLPDYVCKILWSNSKKRREEFPGTQFWAFNLNQPVPGRVALGKTTGGEGRRSGGQPKSWHRCLLDDLKAFDATEGRRNTPSCLLGWRPRCGQVQLRSWQVVPRSPRSCRTLHDHPQLA